MDFSLRVVDNNTLSAFIPYLLPQAVATIANGETSVFAFGAVTGDQTCGAIAGDMDGDELVIFSLYVDEKVRRQGVGKMLLNELLEIVHAQSYRAVWILPEEQFDEVESFFVANGFNKADIGASIYKLSSADFRRAPSLKSAFSDSYRPDGNIVPVSEFTDDEMLELLNDDKIENYLRLDNFTVDELTQPMSLGYRYNGHITAYFICTACSPSEVALRAAFSRSDAPPAAFHLLAAAAIYETIKLMGKDFYCFLSPVTAPALKLTEQLSGGSFEIWQEGSCRKND